MDDTDIEVVQQHNERHYKVNNDIDDVISGGSIEQHLKITKVNHVGRSSPIQKLQDKIELSSNNLFSSDSKSESLKQLCNTAVPKNPNFQYPSSLNNSALNG